jgi:hypothetical protein
MIKSKNIKIGECYKSKSNGFYYRKREHDTLFVNVFSNLITLHSHTTTLETEACSLEEFSQALNQVINKLGINIDDFKLN